MPYNWEKAAGNSCTALRQKTEYNSLKLHMGKTTIVVGSPTEKDATRGHASRGKRLTEQDTLAHTTNKQWLALHTPPPSEETSPYTNQQQQKN